MTVIANPQPPLRASPPPDIDPEAAARLRMAIGRVSRRLRPTAAAAAAGLTPTRATVLLDIVRARSVRLAEVASAEAINPTMLSRVIALLVKDGLVTREADEHDRRSAWVRATPAGVRLAERMRRERTDAVQGALAALDARKRRALLAALPALEAFAEQLGADSDLPAC